MSMEGTVEYYASCTNLEVSVITRFNVASRDDDGYISFKVEMPSDFFPRCSTLQAKYYIGKLWGGSYFGYTLIPCIQLQLALDIRASWDFIERHDIPCTAMIRILGHH